MRDADVKIITAYLKITVLLQLHCCESLSFNKNGINFFKNTSIKYIDYNYYYNIYTILVINQF